MTSNWSKPPTWADMHRRCTVCGLSRQVYIGDSSEYGPVPGPLFGCYCDEVRLAERRKRYHATKEASNER